ncbi:hypothetical protein Tco_0013864 [Tanacetum coccineum]
MNKLSEQVHSVRVSYELCNESHVSKDCPNKEQVKEAEEIYYGEFYQRPYPNGGSKYVEENAKRSKNITYLIMSVKTSSEASLRNQVVRMSAIRVQIDQITHVVRERGLSTLFNSNENPQDQVELSHEEELKKEAPITKNVEESIDIMGIDTDLFCYESPLCLQFKEFNYLLQIEEDLFTYEIMVGMSDDDNEKEILGLNMNAYTYETFYCKQMREDELEAMYHVSEESAEKEEHDIDKPADPCK